MLAAYTFDTLILRYISGTKCEFTPVSEFRYYTGTVNVSGKTTGGKNYSVIKPGWFVMPYDIHGKWTEDKVFFESFDKLTQFSIKTNAKLLPD